MVGGIREAQLPKTALRGVWDCLSEERHGIRIRGGLLLGVELFDRKLSI